MILSAKSRISVIIPVYNGGSNFKSCLSSLVSTISPAREIIVVADGDTDNSWLVAQQFGAKVLRLTTSSGPANARNLGAQHATGDILFFIDADVTIYPNTIAQVEEIFTNQPELAAIIGSYDDEPGENNFLSQYKNLLHHYTHQIASEDAFTFWGACGAIRRDVFLAVGGFDSSWRNRVEDIELGYRLKQTGYKIRLCKDLQVKHLKHWSPISLLKAEFFYRALPWVELIWRDRTVKNDLNLGIASRLSVASIYMLLLALLATFWVSQFFIVAFGLSLVLLGLNLPVYRFFFQKRGFWFTIRVIPWHWFYYLYGGLAFVIGTIRHFWHQFGLFKPNPINAPKTFL
jgi:glycosyltransferase involved in cell wall biosynthesis